MEVIKLFVGVTGLFASVIGMIACMLYEIPAVKRLVKELMA